MNPTVFVFSADAGNFFGQQRLNQYRMHIETHDHTSFTRPQFTLGNQDDLCANDIINVQLVRTHHLNGRQVFRGLQDVRIGHRRQ